MFRPTRHALAGAVAALAMLGAAPAAANASALWVAQSGTHTPPGKSCAKPGFSTIQAAVEAATPGSTINVCPGTYQEQLSITKAVTVEASGMPAATVKLPATPQNSTTACDTAKGTEAFQPDQDLVSICTSGMVKLKGLNFEAKWPAGTCDDSLYGILVAGGATLEADGITIDGAGAFPINGCQGGVGIQVGMAWTTPVEVGHAVLAKDTITNYQKNGMTVDGAGSSANIAGVTVLGAGPTPELAQNGIQVSNGASAKITQANVSGNKCEDNVPTTCGPNAAQAAGVLFFDAASGSSISKSKINNNDLGVYFSSGEATESVSPEMTISGDTFSGDRDEAIVLEQGNAAVNMDKITGPGLVGIDLSQFEGQPFAVTGSATGDMIKGMTEAAIKVESDDKAGDIAGSFTIENSKISKNAAKVVNESKNFTVNTVDDH